MERQSQDREREIVQSKAGATCGCRDQEAGLGDVTANNLCRAWEGKPRSFTSRQRQKGSSKGDVRQNEG